MTLFIEKYIFLVQLKNPTFQEGDSSGGPEYMFHVSGDGVEVSEDSGSPIALKDQSIDPNSNHQPQKVLRTLHKPGFVKQNRNLNQNFGVEHPRPWSGGSRNLDKNLNRNLNRQHHQSNNKHELGHTMERRTLKRNPGLGRPQPMLGDYNERGTDYSEQGFAKQSGDYRMLQQNRNFNQFEPNVLTNRDYAIRNRKFR